MTPGTSGKEVFRPIRRPRVEDAGAQPVSDVLFNRKPVSTFWVHEPGSNGAETGDCGYQLTPALPPRGKMAVQERL